MLVYANPELKVNQTNDFARIEKLLTANSKLNYKQCKQEISSKRY